MLKKTKVNIKDIIFNNKKDIFQILLFLFSLGISVLTGLLADLRLVPLIITLCGAFVFVGVFTIIYVIAYRSHNSIIKNYRLIAADDIAFQMGNTSRATIAEYVCPKHKYHCCVSDLINSEFYKLALIQKKMNNDELAKYNLISDEEFNKIEKNYFTKNKDGEIWVISSALVTEILCDDDIDPQKAMDNSLRQSMEVVKENIKNDGKYVQFVSLGFNGERNLIFQKRQAKYWEADPNLEDDYQRMKKMPVIRIDSDFASVGIPRSQSNDPDLAFMLQLTSTILFVDDTKKEYEGYFCFRPEDRIDAFDYERRTILFKMPSQCMLDAIVGDLMSIKENYLNNLDKRNES